MTEPNGYISAPLNEGLLLARQTDDRLFLFNNSARFIWEQLRAGVEESEIPAQLSAHYGISISQARRDFRTALRQWRRERLLPRGGILKHYELAGLRFDIRFQDVRTANLIAPILMHLQIGSETRRQSDATLEFEFEGRDDEVIVTANGIRLRKTSIGGAIEKLILHLFRHVSDLVNWKVSVHAAAVATNQGCLLLPGRSGSGKSSLAAAMLTQDGVQYVADDLALLTGSLLEIVPVAMPLALKSGSWRALQSFLPDLVEKPIYPRLGKDTRYWTPARNRIADKPLGIRAVIFPRYTEGESIRIVPVSPFEAMGQLTTAPCALRPPITDVTLGDLASFAQRVPTYNLTYGALDSACSAILDLLDK
jgi:hypothetical protein